MIEHIWSVLCERSVTDRETNNMTLLNVLEQVNILGPVPDPATNAALPLPFELVSLWSRSSLAEPEESTGRIRIVAPNGTQLLQSEFPINLSANLRMRTQMKSVALPLSGVGRYMFTVEIRRPAGDWERVASIPVQLESIVHAPTVPASTAE